MTNKPHIYLCDYKWCKIWRVSMPIPYKHRTKKEHTLYADALAFVFKLNRERR